MGFCKTALDSWVHFRERMWFRNTASTYFAILVLAYGADISTISVPRWRSVGVENV